MSETLTGALDDYAADDVTVDPANDGRFYLFYDGPTMFDCCAVGKVTFTKGTFNPTKITGTLYVSS